MLADAGPGARPVSYDHRLSADYENARYYVGNETSKTALVWLSELINVSKNATSSPAQLQILPP